jgi:hypothetical protein
MHRPTLHEPGERNRPVQPTAGEKVRERRLRRAALRKGLHLRKSCMLDADHPEFQRSWVVTTPVRYPEAWRSLGRVLTPRDGVTLDEAAAFVAKYDG